MKNTLKPLRCMKMLLMRVFNRALELEAKIKTKKREIEMQSESRKRCRFEGTSGESRQ